MTIRASHMITQALRKNVRFPVIYFIFLTCLMIFAVVCQWREWWFPPPDLSETITLTYIVSRSRNVYELLQNADYWSNLRFRGWGYMFLTHSFGGKPLNSGPLNLALKETRRIPQC